MLTKLRHKLSSEDNKRLLSNFLSLTFLQGANYILPLISFPYLVRVIGMEKYGLLAFANVTITYFFIITDYGFNLSATRQISIFRNDSKKVSEIFSAVMSIKIILMLISMLLLGLLIFAFDKYRCDYEIYFFSFGMVVGQVLFPIWFFQGMERMKYITYLNVLAKLIFTISIFVFVIEEKDFYKVPLLNAIGFILSGLLSLVLVKKQFKIKFQIQPNSIIKEQLKDGWYIFTSRIYVSLYSTTNLFLLGVMTNNTIVGYYTVADRIISITCRLFSIINQTVYPHMAKLKETNYDQFLLFFKKTTQVFLLSSFFLFSILFIFKKWIILLISGDLNTNVVIIYSILVFTIFTNPFGPFYTQTLLIMKKNEIFNKIVKNTFLFNISISPIFIHYLNGIGLAIVTILSQLFVMSLCFINIKKGIKNEKIS